MSRQLIIIANDGGRQNHLPGVAVDVQHYLRFFRQPEAGLWEVGEIKVFDNNETTLDKQRLSSYILSRRMDGVQFFVIVFCGHGYSNQYGMPFFELSPGNDASKAEIKQMVANSRCLMIADSCRVTYLREGGRMPTVEMFSNTREGDYYRQQCKAIYNDTFGNLPLGTFCLGMAASYNQSASETDSEGGLYSTTLIKTAQGIITKKRSDRHSVTLYQTYSPIETFPVVHAFASQKVRQATGGQQVPENQVFGSSRVPFVVVPEL